MDRLQVAGVALCLLGLDGLLGAVAGWVGFVAAYLFTGCVVAICCLDFVANGWEFVRLVLAWAPALLSARVRDWCVRP